MDASYISTTIPLLLLRAKGGDTVLTTQQDLLDSEGYDLVGCVGHVFKTASGLGDGLIVGYEGESPEKPIGGLPKAIIPVLRKNWEVVMLLTAHALAPGVNGIAELVSDDGRRLLSIYMASGTVRADFTPSADFSSSVGSTAQLEVDKTVDLRLVYSMGTLRLYFNGKLVGNTTKDEKQPNEAKELRNVKLYLGGSTVTQARCTVRCLMVRESKTAYEPWARAREIRTTSGTNVELPKGSVKGLLMAGVKLGNGTWVDVKDKVESAVQNEGLRLSVSSAGEGEDISDDRVVGCCGVRSRLPGSRKAPECPLQRLGVDPGEKGVFVMRYVPPVDDYPGDLTFGGYRTAPLRQFYSKHYRDHRLLSNKKDIEKAVAQGYEEVGVEGYVYEEVAPEHMLSRIDLYWSEERKDSAGIADLDSLRLMRVIGGYKFLGSQGYALPPNAVPIPKRLASDKRRLRRNSSFGGTLTPNTSFATLG